MDNNDYKEHAHYAICYVRDNVGSEDIEREWDYIDKNRCPISQSMEWTIRNLLDDYAIDNDLPKDWWSEYFDIDDIFSQL